MQIFIFRKFFLRLTEQLTLHYLFYFSYTALLKVRSHAALRLL